MKFRRITEKDVAQVSKLIDEMNRNLEDPSFFMTMESDLPSVQKMISKERFLILGAFENGKLAGISALDFKNGKLPEKYRFPVWCDVTRMVEFSFNIVGLEFRGKGLMFQMLTEIKKVALSMGFEFACATVHKDNIASRKTLEKIGLEFYREVELETPFPRNLMLMKLI